MTSEAIKTDKPWEGELRVASPLCLESLQAYVNEGRPTGGFLRAVLANDLFEAVGKADSQNILCLREIIGWVYWNVPREAWRSYGAVDAWIKQKNEVKEAQ